MIKRVVLVHGWGLNSAVWNKYAAAIRAARPGLAVQQIDMPGYGRLAADESPGSLYLLAQACLEQVSEPALWVGWSLGGMVAMQAALIDRSPQIQALQLVNTTARFRRAEDWSAGTDLSIFDRFCLNLAHDYQRTLNTFLLLLAGRGFDARTVARKAHSAISQWPGPSLKTLQSGIACLTYCDLRSELENIRMPVQVVSGERDRVINPESSRLLAQTLRAEWRHLGGGHAPFLTHQTETLCTLLSFIDAIENDNPCS